MTKDLICGRVRAWNGSRLNRFARNDMRAISSPAWLQQGDLHGIWRQGPAGGGTSSLPIRRMVDAEVPSAVELGGSLARSSSPGVLPTELLGKGVSSCIGVDTVALKRCFAMGSETPNEGGEPLNSGFNAPTDDLAAMLPPPSFSPSPRGPCFGNACEIDGREQTPRAPRRSAMDPSPYHGVGLV